MSLQSVLHQVETWSLEDRLRLIEQIWDGILDRDREPGLTEAEKSEIDRRISDDDASPDDAIPWDEVKAEALRRIAQ